MKNLKKINLKENIIKDTDGITLISLVVTLIVIIIIATITISVSIDNEGVFTIMSQEKEKFEDKTAKQEGKIDELYTQIEYGANSEFLNEYTRVEYIKSTGTQWIDTGFVANQGMIAEYEAEFTELGTGCYVVGSHNLTDPYGRNYGALGWSGRWELGYGNICSVSNVENVNLNQKYKVKFSTIINDAYMYVDNVKVLSSNATQALSNQNVMILTNSYINNNSLEKGYAKIYNCKIWNNNGKLVRDFIPCIRNTDNKPGLYDKVNQTFYTNSGSGEFVTP